MTQFTPQPDPPLARSAKAEYCRNLPHLQHPDRPIFLTFCTRNRWILPDRARDLVLRHCLHDHGKKIHVHGAIVMPDHVHMVLTLLRDPLGNVYGLAEVTSGIKGASAHSINRQLNRKGPVWQEECFDHILRSGESLVEKVNYICANPVRRGLCTTEEQYPWLWREWVEGAST